MIVNGKIINRNVPIDKFNKNTKNINKNNKTSENNFGDILNNKLNSNQEIKISKHAEIRMKERQIDLTDKLKDKINNSIERANKKGVKDSLVIVEDSGFIVNVKSKTVITAFSSNELKESVFTNIDGAVISE
ncbi:MAG: TIGR02530 family flagellar biosynthesis protein [Clostridiales bacterium]